jgi:hypothetical protein
LSIAFLKKSQKNQKNTNISTLKEVLFLWAKTAHEPQLPTSEIYNLIQSRHARSNGVPLLFHKKKGGRF